MLELGLRLQRTTDVDAEVVRPETLDFWREEGREHVRLEEALLLPAFARHVGADDEDVVRVLVAHVDIRRRIADLEEGLPVEDLHALGERLRDHVRPEEGKPCGRIETALSPEELGVLGGALKLAGEAHRPPRA